MTISSGSSSLRVISIVPITMASHLSVVTSLPSPDRLVIDSVLIGDCERGKSVGRRGARPGDACLCNRRDRIGRRGTKICCWPESNPSPALKQNGRSNRNSLP